MSLLAWWAVGALLGERPVPAQPGQSYPLVEKSNCRWASGECHLENADFLVKLTVADARVPTLIVHASYPVDALLVSVGVDANASPQPMQQTPGASQGRVWQLELPHWPGPGERIRLAVQAKSSAWYGEAGVTFMQMPAVAP